MGLLVKEHVHVGKGVVDRSVEWREDRAGAVERPRLGSGRREGGGETRERDREVQVEVARL